jgi:hypothetical protein
VVVPACNEESTIESCSDSILTAERMCTDVLDRFGRATGPHLLAFDAQMAQRHAELYLYIRQCHAERDLAAIPR